MSDKTLQIVLDSHLSGFNKIFNQLHEEGNQRCEQMKKEIITMFSNINLDDSIVSNMKTEIAQLQAKIKQLEQTNNEKCEENKLLQEKVFITHGKPNKDIITTPFYNHNDYFRYCIYWSKNCQYMSKQKFENSLWNMSSNLISFSRDTIGLSGRCKDWHTSKDVEFKIYGRMLQKTEPLMVNLTEDDYLQIFGILFKICGFGDNKSFKLWLGDYHPNICSKIDNMKLSVDADINKLLFNAS